MAETLHSLNILNSKSFTILSSLKLLSNNHFASVMVKEISHDLKERKKYHAFLKFLLQESSLLYLLTKMLDLS